MPTLQDPMQNFVEIYDFWRTPWWQTKVFYIILASIALLSFILFVWLIIRFVKSRRKITPWEQALHELAILKQMPVTSEQSIAKHYFALRTLIKKYIDARHAVSFADKTDEELVQALPGVIEQDDIMHDIKELLQQSEQAVFASAYLTPMLLTASIDKTVSVIKRTIPQSNKK